MSVINVIDSNFYETAVRLGIEARKVGDSLDTNKAHADIMYLRGYVAGWAAMAIAISEDMHYRLLQIKDDIEDAEESTAQTHLFAIKVSELVVAAMHDIAPALAAEWAARYAEKYSEGK